MQTKIIEATQNAEHGFNWGKFLVGRPDAEWKVRSAIPVEHPSSARPLLSQLGWSREHAWVLDLQTGEGAFFRLGGFAPADLNKHRIWVCPMFEPFLVWLYEQDTTDLDALPALVELPLAPPSMAGYRRAGE
jgi:hypothetical protein